MLRAKRYARRQFKIAYGVVVFAPDAGIEFGQRFLARRCARFTLHQRQKTVAPVPGSS